MLDIFNKSQQSIGKTITESFASEQHNRMYNEVNNKEDTSMIIDVMPYVIDEDIALKYKQLCLFYQSESRYVYSYTIT